MGDVALVPGEIPLAALAFRYRLDSEQFRSGPKTVEATNVNETDLNWEWTTECGTAAYCAWYVGH